MNGERGQSAKKRFGMGSFFELFPSAISFHWLAFFFVTMAADHQFMSYQEDPLIYKQCDPDIIENLVSTCSEGLKQNFNLLVL